MIRLSSPHARMARGLLFSLSLLSPQLVRAQKIEIDKSVPPKERARLQLGIDAMTKDRDKKDYKAAQTKLKKALTGCKTDRCPPADQAQIEFFLGIVQAEGGDEKAAQASFESALKVNPSFDPSGGLSSPPTDRAFAAAKAAVLPPPAAPSAPAAPAAPADSGFNPTIAQPTDDSVSAVGGAKYQPGLGFVQGTDANLGKIKNEGAPAAINVPKLDQSSVWDSLGLRTNFGLSYTSYKLNDHLGAQKKLGGLMLDVRVGAGLRLWDLLVPSIDFDVSGGKFGEDTHFLLISGGNYEMWALNGGARAGLDLDVEWFQLGGFGGAFLNYYSPSLENLPLEPSDSGKDAGALYGARARLGHDLFVELSYTWKRGQDMTGRYRRIDVGSMDDDGGWSLFWEARERPSATPGAGATQQQRLLGAMPLNFSLGFSIRGY
jgi:hypothetical protein